MTEKTDSEVQAEVEQRLSEIEMYERLAQEQGLRYRSLPMDMLEQKVRSPSTGTPYIYSYAWSWGSKPGSKASFTAHIANPDPIAHLDLVFSLFFGVANMLEDHAFAESAFALSLRGSEGWPTMSNQLGLAAGATQATSFSYEIPVGARPTTYFGNGMLWKAKSFAKGDMFHRCLFHLYVE